RRGSQYGVSGPAISENPVPIPTDSNNGDCFTMTGNPSVESPERERPPNIRVSDRPVPTWASDAEVVSRCHLLKVNNFRSGASISAFLTTIDEKLNPREVVRN